MLRNGQQVPSQVWWVNGNQLLRLNFMGTLNGTYDYTLVTFDPNKPTKNIFPANLPEGYAFKEMIDGETAKYEKSYFQTKTLTAQQAWEIVLS